MNDEAGNRQMKRPSSLPELMTESLDSRALDSMITAEVHRAAISRRVCVRRDRGVSMVRCELRRHVSQAES
jgi:hypothetical protein